MLCLSVLIKHKILIASARINFYSKLYDHNKFLKLLNVPLILAEVLKAYP
jgi:hypothetical protein